MDKYAETLSSETREEISESVSVTQILGASVTGHMHQELGCSSERTETRQPAIRNLKK
jgi:hypothetical protein